MKRKKNHFSFQIFLWASTLVCLLVARCKTVENAPVKINRLPTSYSSPVTDTANTAAEHWQAFYRDTVLRRLINEGLKNNPEINIAFQRSLVAEAEAGMSRGKLFPEINANGTYSLRKFGLYTMDGAGNISTDILPGRIVPIHLPDYYLGLQTSWEADIWGKLRSRKKAAISRYFSSVEGQHFLKTNLVSEIAHCYYNLVFLDKELSVIRSTIALQAQAVELVNYQKQAGTVTELAVKQFRAQLLAEQAMEYEVLQEINENENQLNYLIGRYSGRLPRSVTQLSDSFEFIPRSGVPEDLLSNRPDIRRAEMQIESSKADLSAAKAAFYPGLNIFAAAGFQAFQPAFFFQLPQSLAYTVLGSISAPLINRAAIKARFKAANAKQVEALYEYQKCLLNAFKEVNTHLANIDYLKQIVKLKSTQLEEAKSSWEISSELFSSNRANYVEVLISQKVALETNLLLLDAQHRQFNASIDLYKALGGGWR